MTHLKLNDPAPDFEAPLTGGEALHLAALRGQYVVLYFYPRDNTPGCTTEARDFEALLPEFRRHDTRVVGVSRDSQSSHRKFCEKQGLTFDLVADESGAVCEQYGVLQPKKMFGREYLGIVRSTFLVDPEGRLRAIWPKVKVDGHALEVLETLRRLQAE